jgi:hypothetical protein
MDGRGERLKQNISGATVLLCCSYSGPVKMHLEGLMEDNLPIPESQFLAEYVAVG